MPRHTFGLSVISLPHVFAGTLQVDGESPADEPMAGAVGAGGGAVPAGRPVAWVGGADDRRSRIARRVFDDHRVEGRDGYFEHHQRDALADWIDRQNARGAKPLVIGHSWGAVSAARVVAEGHEVHELRTVDPVGRNPRFRRPGFLRKVARNAGAWTNYDSTSTAWTRNNIVAWLGGSWDDLPGPYATLHVEVPELDHGEICETHCPP